MIYIYISQEDLVQPVLNLARTLVLPFALVLVKDIEKASPVSLDVPAKFHLLQLVWHDVLICRSFCSNLVPPRQHHAALPASSLPYFGELRVCLY